MKVGIHFPGGGGGHYLHALVQILLGAPVPERDFDEWGSAHGIPSDMPYSIDNDTYRTDRINRNDVTFVKDMLTITPTNQHGVYISHLTIKELQSLSSELKDTKNILVTFDTHVDTVVSLMRQFHKQRRTTDIYEDQRYHFWAPSIWGKIDKFNDMSDNFGLDIDFNDLSLDIRNISAPEMMIYSIFSANDMQDKYKTPVIDLTFDSTCVRFGSICTPAGVRQIARYLGEMKYLDNGLAYAEKYRKAQPTFDEMVNG